MKTAIFYSGQFRTFDKCFDNHKEKVFCKLDKYDIYLDIQVDNMEDCKKEIDFIKSISNLKKYNIYSTNIPLDYRISIKPTGLRGTLEGWLRQLKSNNDSFLLCEGKEYDSAIRIRTDSLFQNSMEDIQNLDLKNIYIPNHDNWHGINDRFAIGSLQNIEKYMSFYSEIYKLGNLSLYNAESYMKFYIEEYCKINILRTKLKANTLREDGTLLPIYENN